MEARCQCGSVTFQTPLAKPLALYICHCVECRRQASSAFGTSAIFPRFPLPRSELLSCYTRPTESGHMLYCYFCRNCGTRMLHMASGKNVVSVKGGCIEGLDWSGAIHIWTKSAMVPIPEGCESYSREPWDSGHSTSQDSLDQSPRNRTLDASHGSGDDGFRELAGSGGFESAGEEEMGKGGQDGAAAPTCGRIKGGCEFSMV